MQAPGSNASPCSDGWGMNGQICIVDAGEVLHPARPSVLLSLGQGAASVRMQHQPGKGSVANKYSRERRQG